MKLERACIRWYYNYKDFGFHQRLSWNYKGFCVRCEGDLMKKKALIVLSILLGSLLTLGVLVAVLLWNGVILLNNPSKDEYPVRGVDVSAYQGEIDWKTLSGQGIDFAFIKSTEGSSFRDRHFGFNWEQAQKTELSVGAYHFFGFDSAGVTQAENFINAVIPFDGMLPPVIDIEFYGDKEKNPPSRADVGVQLKAMLNALEEHYGLKPIIYATKESYELYLDGDYAEYDIWIRDVIGEPSLSDGRQWTFWQYTNRETLDGYKGEEKYIDVNVFNGGLAEFLNYPRYKR